METKFLPATQIGRFRVEAEVGQGGMGVIYRCFDPILKRPVALKLLAPHLGSDPKALARFHREAALAASLKHSHIAIVYDFGQYEGQPYMALQEFVPSALICHSEGRGISLFLQARDSSSLGMTNKKVFCGHKCHFGNKFLKSPLYCLGMD